MNKTQIKTNEEFSENIIDYFKFIINNEYHFLKSFIIDTLIVI